MLATGRRRSISRTCWSITIHEEAQQNERNRVPLLNSIVCTSSVTVGATPTVVFAVQHACLTGERRDELAKYHEID